jgi:putative transposase
VVRCQVLDVSESGFYAWRKRPTCRHQREDAQLTETMRQVFASHSGRYGSRRLHADLRDQGMSCSRKRVARLMREAGIAAKRNRRRVVTTRRAASHPVAPNGLERDFTATEPHKKWATDITSIPTAHAWLYLAVILDRSSRSVVGWSLSDWCDEERVENALNMALARRRPKTGLLHHSDRASQETSRAYRLLLEQSGIIVSLSRKGKCWDNAVMQSVCGTLKEECVGSMIYSS